MFTIYSTRNKMHSTEDTIGKKVQEKPFNRNFRVYLFFGHCLIKHPGCPNGGGWVRTIHLHRAAE